MYKFEIMDPRNIPAATTANDAIFASGAVYGIEVTVPALAARCACNLDPQHSGGDINQAAIQAACRVDVPAEDSVLATVRPDLDAIGAMVILSLRAQMKQLGAQASRSTDFRVEVVERIELVADADKFARGGYPGPKSLPTRECPWDEKSASVEGSRPLAAIAAAVADHKVPLADRVATMEKWLLTGEEPASYRASVEKERLDMITALESGAIQHELRADGKIAVVESTHRAATAVGYALAPVVVALNPSFKLGVGEPHRKFTVCVFEPKFADIKSALAELATLELGWGGSPTIGGSPQGVSSQLTLDQVVEVIIRYLR